MDKEEDGLMKTFGGSSAAEQLAVAQLNERLTQLPVETSEWTQGELLEAFAWKSMVISSQAT